MKKESQRGKPSPWLWVLIGVAVLGVIGIVSVVGGLGLLYNIGQSSIEETTAALVAEQSTQTAVSILNSAPTATKLVLAQATPTQEPSAEPSATAEPPVFNEDDYLTATVSPDTIQAEAQQWPAIFTDSFDNNDNEWTLKDNESEDYAVETVSIEDGVLRWTVKAKQDFYEYKVQDTDIGPVFSTSVDITQVEGQWKEEVGDYGLVFHLVDIDNFYYFSIDENGNYSVFIKLDGEWSPIINFEITDLVQTGNDVVNKLTVVGQGPYYGLFINDQLVNQVKDDRLEGGYAGIVIEVFNAGDQLSLEFDNLEVRVP